MSPSPPKRSAASSCDASCIAPSVIADLPIVPCAFYRPSGGAARGASAAPAQHTTLDRIDEGAAGGPGAAVFLLQTVIPFGLGIGVVDEHERRVVLQSVALHHHDPSVLVEERADIRTQCRLQR